MSNSTILISFISGILGSISVIVTVYSLISNRVNQSKKLKSLEEQNFETILASSDIKILGKYLDFEIGQMTISDYVDNKNINRRIDILINKLTQFVGTEEQIIKETEEQVVDEKLSSERKQQLIDFPYKGKLGDDFDKVLNELYFGEPWNALARLRRLIEMTLRKLADSKSIATENITSVTRLIELLKHYGIIDNYIVNNLQFPIHISNRAVHGQDLNQGEAQEAIFHAAIALERIIKTLE
jgi:hypothetical protein